MVIQDLLRNITTRENAYKQQDRIETEKRNSGITFQPFSGTKWKCCFTPFAAVMQ